MPDPADDDLLMDWTLYYDGREDCASAAVASYRRGQCCVLTAEPDAYAIGGRRPEWVIPIDGKNPRTAGNSPSDRQSGLAADPPKPVRHMINIGIG
jgi:hypothetical protein